MMTNLEEVDLDGSVAEVHDNSSGGPEPGLQGRNTGQHILVTDLYK